MPVRYAGTRFNRPVNRLCYLILIFIASTFYPPLPTNYISPWRSSQSKIPGTLVEDNRYKMYTNQTKFCGHLIITNTIWAKECGPPSNYWVFQVSSNANDTSDNNSLDNYVLPALECNLSIHQRLEILLEIQPIYSLETDQIIGNTAYPFTRDRSHHWKHSLSIH